jgi:hypothetical protein
VCVSEFRNHRQSQGFVASRMQMEWNVRDANLLYIFAICSAGLFLFVTVNRLERNRPLATLLMILILGVTAAAVLKQLMP